MSVPTLRNRAVFALAAFASALVLLVAIPSDGSAATKNVIAVGNAAGGTVSFLDGSTLNNLGSFNATPDKFTRKALIFLNPVTLVGWNVVKGQKGGERLVDDVATSPDGKTLYVSRGMLMDVAAFNLVTKKMLWRTDMNTFNSDHMAISPDGTKLVVSATTANQARVINAANGSIIKSLDTGDYPHENTFSADGKTLYNASIGTTALPYSLNALKGNKQLTLFDTTTWEQKGSHAFDWGIRPSALTADERYYYMQLSYQRGFVEYDLYDAQITRTATLPGTAAGDALFPDKLPSNSMHHGLAINGAETKLCNAGTIDNYVKIVARSNFAVSATVNNQQKPYWAQTSHDGNKCLVSNSDGDFVSVISYDTGLEVKRVAVGDFPQRERPGKLDSSVVLSSSKG